MIYEPHPEIKKKFPFIIHTDTNLGGINAYLHWHDSLEILHCIDGSGTVILDSRPIKMDKGSTVIINPGFSHAISSEQKVVYHCLIVGEDFLKDVADIHEMYSFATIINDNELSKYLCDIIEEYKEKKDGYELAIKGKMLSSLSIIYRFSGNTVPKTDDTYIKQAIKYIKNNFNEDILLDDIASSVGLSKSYFMNKFKKYTGCTVNEYLRHVRCKHAKHLLSQHQISISEVALQCGFSDISYFTKVFKTEIGVLPSKFTSEIDYI